tara:strand:- start:364 stop:1080 length:717 start_codon:yes stop_codon:yes gene_type:complete
MHSKKKLPIIIFARCSSKRFPNKVMSNFGNKMLIEHVLERVNKIKLKSNVIIATSELRSDDKLINFIKSKKLSYYRGSLNNVVLRAYECCKKYKINEFVRICCDRIYLSADEINSSIEKYNKNKKKTEIASNLMSGKIPAGKTIEIIKKTTLEKILNFTKNKYDLEHVTKFIYKNKKKFRILKLKKPKYNSLSHRFAIDNYADKKRVEFIESNKKKKEFLSDGKIIQLTTKFYNNHEK